MHRSTPLAAVVALALVACGDQTRSAAPTAPPALPLAALSDGRSGGGGNPDFFFLPPLAGDPALLPAPSPFDAAAFSAAHRPEVQICEYTDPAPALDDGRCDTPVIAFDGDQIKLSVENQHYAVNWNTDPTSWPPAVVYRIRVLSGGVALGFVDVSASRASTLVTDGRTVPIKFRIEVGALSPGDGSSTADYGEKFITNAGGRLVTAPGYAGAEFTRGWLDGKNVDGVLVTIERLQLAPGTTCHPVTTGLVQYAGCYRYETYPDVGQFSGVTPAVVAMCEDIPTPTDKARRLYKSDGGAPAALAEVPTTLFAEHPEGRLTCANYPNMLVAAARFGRVGAALQAVAAAVGRALTPRPLYAVDLGAGGRAVSFSNVSLGVDAQLDPSDYPPAVLTGTTVPVSVRVYTPHIHHDHSTEEAVVGQTVTFTATTGTLPGGATSIAVVTGSDGKAATAWTLPTDGSHTLVASVAGRTTTFEITAVPAGAAGDKNRFTLKIEPGRASKPIGAPQTFKATLTNPSGTVLPRQPIAWTITPATGVTILRQDTALDQNGSALLTLVGTIARNGYTITGKGGPVSATATFVVTAR